MKKYFDIVEKLEFSHRIEIEIDESKEDEYEDFAEQVAEDMDSRGFDTKEDILKAFTDEFGEDSIEFSEDDSPSVEFQAY